MATGLGGSVATPALAMAGRLIHLVRHAHAGDRDRWPQNDDLRPLSARGCAQADALVDVLAERSVELVLASPSVRCMATVLPLARARGLTLHTEECLYEGRDAAVMLRRVAAATAGSIVACTHGDILDSLLDLLQHQGMGRPIATAPKGCILSLRMQNQRVEAVAYVPPP